MAFKLYVLSGHLHEFSLQTYMHAWWVLQEKQPAVLLGSLVLHIYKTVELVFTATIGELNRFSAGKYCLKACMPLFVQTWVE
jgi:hypothetical protein